MTLAVRKAVVIGRLPKELISISSISMYHVNGMDNTIDMGENRP
jgi:hypothetical protein